MDDFPWVIKDFPTDLGGMESDRNLCIEEGLLINKHKYFIDKKPYKYGHFD